MSAGSVLLFSGRTIRGGGVNTTVDTWRTCLHVGYQLGWLRSEEAHPLALSSEIQADRRVEHKNCSASIYEESTDQHLHELGGPYVPTLGRIYSGWNCSILGDDEASKRWIDDAIEAVPESRQPFNHCYALLFRTILAG